MLATINTVDFIYTCDAHLTDRGFASLVESTDTARKPDIGADEIAKVKEEWEEKQKRKAEKEKADKEKEKEKEKDKEKKDDKKDNEKEKEGSKSPKIPGSLSPPTPQTPAATHQRYTLHRDMFSMRLTEHRKRRQASQAKELAPRLPGAPRGDVI